MSLSDAPAHPPATDVQIQIPKKTSGNDLSNSTMADPRGPDAPSAGRSGNKCQFAVHPA